MKKTISVLALASVFTAGSAFASAYRIPEQSYDSTAKAGADIASSTGADASYYNPANMSWLQSAWQVEGNLEYIHLASIKYEDARTSLYDGKSKEENFLLPTVFMVSPDYNNVRFGFSITAPYGLSKRWDDIYPATFAQKFNLEVFDINPTVSYKINNYLSVAGGVRLLHSTATVDSEGYVASGITASRTMDGDNNAWGYNLAVSAKPDAKSNISMTYRSNVEMKLDGNAQLTTNLGPTVVDTRGNVKVDAPAVFALSGSYFFMDKLTVELTWDRTFWSDYKNLDFNYATSLANPVLYKVFDAPIAKNWKDSNAYRLGLSYKLNEMMTLMAGFAYDQTPVPADTLGFELPDSDAYLFSLGARFKVAPQTELGIGLLYDMKSNRTVDNGQVDGKISDASALLVSAGVTYTF